MKTLILIMVVLMFCERAANQNVSPHRQVSGSSSNSTQSEAPLCITEECVSTAARILNSLDRTVHPCHDFYQFACGGWIKEQIIPPDRDSLMSLYQYPKHIAITRNLLRKKHNPLDPGAVKKAKDLYSSCINYATQSTKSNDILAVINNTFGSWPFVDENWNAATFDLKTFIIKAIHLGVHPLLHLVVDNMVFRDNTRYNSLHVLRLKSPQLTLPAETYHKMGKLGMETFAKKIVSDAERFGLNTSIADIAARAQNDSQTIVEVEKQLSQMIIEDTIQKNRYYNISSLQHRFGQIMNMTQFFFELVASRRTGIHITLGEKVYITYKRQFITMMNYFSRLPKRTQANYIIWRVIDSLENTLVQRHDKLSTLWKNADTIIREIKREFDQLVDDSDWMDFDAKNGIKKMNAELRTLFVDWNESMNTTYMDAFYANITVNKNNFFQNVLEEKDETFYISMRILRKPYKFQGDICITCHRYTAAEYPYSYVKQSHYRENQIALSPFVFEPPSFTTNIPESLNYGGFGFMFSQALVNVLEHSRTFNHTIQTVGQWWNSETLENFRLRQECLVIQYETQFYKEANATVNATLTLDANMVDRVALKISYQAFLKYQARVSEMKRLPGLNFTQNQLFFINYAQTECAVENQAAAKLSMKNKHAPNRIRVTETIKNSHGFPSAFRCSLGSLMHSPIKCGVW